MNMEGKFFHSFKKEDFREYLRGMNKNIKTKNWLPHEASLQNKSSHDNEKKR